MSRKLTAALVSLLLFAAAGTGVAQPMKGMEGTTGMTGRAQAAIWIEDQPRRRQAELKAPWEEPGALQEAGGGPRPMGPGPMPVGSGGPIGPRTPRMMAQMGGMGAMTPETQSRQESEPTEHGAKQVGGLEVTLLSAPPLSPAEMQRMMLGMGGQRDMPGMGSMPGMGGMMRGMPGMGGPGGAEGHPTHWIGVVVRDMKDDRAVQGLRITLTAQKDRLARTVTLMPMPGSYGANISLPEKGRYTVTLGIAQPRQPLSVAFDFEYK